MSKEKRRIKVKLPDGSIKRLEMPKQVLYNKYKMFSLDDKTLITDKEKNEIKEILEQTSGNLYEYAINDIRSRALYKIFLVGPKSKTEALNVLKAASNIFHPNISRIKEQTLENLLQEHADRLGKKKTTLGDYFDVIALEDIQ